MNQRARRALYDKAMAFSPLAYIFREPLARSPLDQPLTPITGAAHLITTVLWLVRCCQAVQRAKVVRTANPTDGPLGPKSPKSHHNLYYSNFPQMCARP